MRVRLVNYKLLRSIPFLNAAFQAASFTADLPRESLGIHSLPGVVTPMLNARERVRVLVDGTLSGRAE